MCLSSSFFCITILSFCNQAKIKQYYNTQDNTVPAKNFKIMFLDVAHEEFDYEDGHYKSYNHTCQQDGNFHTSKMYQGK